MAGGQQDGAVELDNEDGDEQRRKGMAKCSRGHDPLHCTATASIPTRPGCALLQACWGALGAWIPGDRLVLLGAAWIFRGGRWRLQTCADPETQELGSKKRKRGMGRKVHFCKSLGGGSRIPGLHLHLQLDRLVLPRATAHHPPRREGANPWTGNGISSCPIRGR